jgi:hypothetical protein
MENGLNGYVTGYEDLFDNYTGNCLTLMNRRNITGININFSKCISNFLTKGKNLVANGSIYIEFLEN